MAATVAVSPAPVPAQSLSGQTLQENESVDSSVGAEAEKEDKPAAASPTISSVGVVESSMMASSSSSPKDVSTKLPQAVGASASVDEETHAV